MTNPRAAIAVLSSALLFLVLNTGVFSPEAKAQGLIDLGNQILNSPGPGGGMAPKKVSNRAPKDIQNRAIELVKGSTRNQQVQNIRVAGSEKLPLSDADRANGLKEQWEVEVVWIARMADRWVDQRSSCVIYRKAGNVLGSR